MMRILKAELGKLATPSALLSLVVCILINAGLVLVYRYKIVDYSFFSYVAETACVTGNVLGDEFSEKLSLVPESDQKSRLASETRNPSPVFADYDTGALAGAYIAFYGISGTGAELLRTKYEWLRAAVKELAEEGAEFSLYSADTTVQMHEFLFSVLFRAVLAESCILAALMMLHLCTCEHQNHTELTVCTTRTGRSVFWYKLRAGLLASAVCYVLLSGATLSLYFHVFDYSKLWDSNVSSGFHSVSDRICTKPFFTWVPFTLWEYLLAVLGLGFCLTLVFALMGAVIGALSQNSYVGTLLFFLLALAMMALPHFCSETGLWGGYFLSQFSPVRLWYLLPEWFTDLGSFSVIPFHETAGTFFNVLLFWVLAGIAYRYVKERDML